MKPKTRKCKALTNNLKKCGNIFTVFGKSTRRFCSDSCRKRNHRKLREKRRDLEKKNEAAYKAFEEQQRSAKTILADLYSQMSDNLEKRKLFNNPYMGVPEEKSREEMNDNYDAWLHYNKNRDRIMKMAKQVELEAPLKLPVLEREYSKLYSKFTECANNPENEKDESIKELVKYYSMQLFIAYADATIADATIKT